MNFEEKTYQSLLASQLAQVPDSLDKREGSMIQTALGPAAWALEGLYMQLAQVQQNAFALTAAGEWLDLKAAEAGLHRKEASAAIRLGEFNMDVPIGSRFATNDGAASLVFGAVERIAAGRYRMECETSGSVGNGYTGPLLAISYVRGLQTAVLRDVLIPGEDAESDDSLRSRYVVYLTQKPFGGNIADYRNNILAMQGVAACQIYPAWQGGGSVKCSILGTGYAPASAELVETVQNAIDPPVGKGLGYGLAPIGAQVTIATPAVVTVDVAATLTLAAGYSIGQVEESVKEAIAEYLAHICAGWDTPIAGSGEYISWVFVSQVTAAMLSVMGVINATNVQLNGSMADIHLLQTGAVQQIPGLGVVHLDV